MSFGVLDGDGNVAQIEGHPFGRIQFTGVRYAQADIRLLSPILPSKVVGIGKNYAEHVAEMNTGDAPKEPLMFLKPSTAVIGPEDAIRIPRGSTNVHHEVELAVVIGARGARGSRRTWPRSAWTLPTSRSAARWTASRARRAAPANCSSASRG